MTWQSQVLFKKYMINFKTTTITELHKKLISGEVSSSELVQQSKSAISEKNGDINAIIEVFDGTFIPEKITEKSSLLAGIPVAVKDNILFKGHTVTAASNILAEYKATYNSKIADIFNTSEVSLIGRANMDEMAMGTTTETSRYGSTKNPVDITRVPGGSSGGPAAAVASGMVMYALGSDTGGSIRQPASLCGVVGMKPSYGAVSRRGLMAMSSSLDTIGPFANSVEDAEIIFNEIAEYDELDATSVSLEKRATYQDKNKNNKIIGIPRSFLEMDGIQNDVLENFNKSIEKMKNLGYEIIDIDLPLLKHSLAVYYIVQPAEVSSNMARYDGIRYGLHKDGDNILDIYKNTKTSGYGDEVKRRIMLGTYVLSSGYSDEYYYKANALRGAITREIHEAFNNVDIIATPTAPSTAFKFGEKKDPISLYLEDVFTVPYNLTGNPAISIPSGVNNDGLPFGMHFSAPMFCEKKLFEIGKDFENIIKQ